MSFSAMLDSETTKSSSSSSSCSSEVLGVVDKWERPIGIYACSSTFWEPEAKRASQQQHTSTFEKGTGKRKLATTTKRLRRKRPEPKTRTAEVRRVEIDALRKESAFLEAKVEFLQYRAGNLDQQTLNQQALENALLREFLRNQNYLMAGLKSALAIDMSDHFPSPLSTTICLGSDLAARQQLLLAIKPQKIHDARQFLEKRTQFFDMSKPLSDVTRMQAPDGAICTSKVDVIPLYNATSVKQVYDLLHYYSMNVEIGTAEVNGDIVIREETETETGDDSVWQNRFLFLKKEHGADVETNNTIFCEYTPRKKNLSSAYSPSVGAELQSDEGLIVFDFVDEDELYPYRPSERMRDDVTSVLMVKAYHLPACTATSRQSSPPRDQWGDLRTGNVKQQEVVVLTRWVQTKFHQTQFDIPDDILFDLRRVLDRACDAVLQLVQARFRSQLTHREPQPTLLLEGEIR